jgi:hypothetical protein
MRVEAARIPAFLFMPATLYRNRRAVSIENDVLRLTVTEEGGHIAEILDKKSGVKPLWTPPWPSIEPSTYDAAKNPEYGTGPEAKLLAGILGHNLCMDIFGGPSEEEAAAGLTVHGEASVARYQVSDNESDLTMQAEFPIAQLNFERRVELKGNTAEITEWVTNLSGADRPIGWTQHVTLGPPFLEKGSTEFRASATQSLVHPEDFTQGKGYMKTGAEFLWPNVPSLAGGVRNMQTFVDLPVSGAYSAHLMDPARETAFFSAFSPKLKLAISYIWRPTDFPWLGIWEENHGRTHAPWNGEALTRGMEFGVSPIPETRRQMIERGKLFGAPTFRWIPAKTRVQARYWAVLEHTAKPPEPSAWPAK